MRAVAFTVLVALIASPAVAFSAAPAAPAPPIPANDEAAIIQVVSEAYVDGIHNFRNPVAIRKGFHPGFEMLVLKDGQLDKLPIETWIQNLEARNQKEPPPKDGKRTTEARFPRVDVTGSAAICKVEIGRDGKLVFTDYLSLYKFADGWKIVGKTFFRHP